MEGDIDSEIILIGEYPGEQEVAFNKPFVGASGKHLWTALREVGIHRGMCYSTNVLKRRVSPKMSVDHREFLLWQEALQYELSLLTKPKVIVCLGATALAAVLGFEGITEYRGSVYDYNGCKVVVANNPATVLRRPETELIFLMDMSKVSEVYKDEFVPHIINSTINPSYEEAMNYMSAIKKQYKIFSMDIEVIGMETACIGLAHTPHDAMCIPFRSQKDLYFSLEQEYNILRAFADLTDDKDTFCIAQNGNFDSYFMGYKDHLRFRIDFDTLLAHHTLYPKLPHNLGFLTAQYTSHPFYKDEKELFKESGDINAFWKYNCTDAAITFACAEKLKKELQDQNQYQFFTTHVMAAHPHLTQATVDGVKVNAEKKQELNSQLRNDLEVHEAKFLNACRTALHDEDFIINPKSPKQLQELFFDKLNCRAAKRSVVAEIREGWAKDPRVNSDTRNVIIALDKYIEEQKFYSTYVNTQLDPDNRFRAEYKQFGVSNAPGRLSSSQTLWGSGGNAQNQPRRAREMFEADDGCIFIYFDLAQAEARYVGWDANIEQWIEDFERARIDGNFDAHRSLAATMFNIPYDDVPTKDEIDGEFTLRYIAKRCRHGLNYRMHIARLAITTGLSYGMAARNYYAYHKTNPELQVWWKAVEKEVKKSRMLYNSIGRRFLFTERLDNDGALDSIIAYRPQSTIGDKVVRVWKQCQEDNRWNMQKARIAINVHDALWGISTPAFANTALSIMKAYAEEPIMVTSIVTKKTSPLIIPADLKISDMTEGLPRNMANMKGICLDAARI